MVKALSTLTSIFNGDITAELIVEFVFVVMLLVLFNVFVLVLVRRITVLVSSIIFTAGFLISYVFGSTTLQILFVAGLVMLFLISMFANLAEFRKFFANNIDKNKKRKQRKISFIKRMRLEKLSNKESFYEVINSTVLYLSQNKIGAIMTFERNDNLSELSFLKNGVKLNCPITEELLVTIFYPGTRLHDGAVIIKNNLIEYASVFFQPSTKPLHGKYGSRHRAALGISEICDAVTIVVSEETGRISIALNGDLSSFSNDNFIKAFINFMQEEEN